MARARPAGTTMTITAMATHVSVTLCVGLLALAGCSGVGVDEEASPASTERSEATERTRSSIAEAGTSTSTTTTGPATGTGTSSGVAGSSSTGPSTAPGRATSPASPSTSVAGEGEAGGTGQLAGPLGFGQDTTGGAGGPTVTVSSPAALTGATAGDEPRVIQVVGTLALDGIVPVGSNKTVVGVTGTAGPARLVGGGLGIEAARNVIVRNLDIAGSGGDDLHVAGATDVWIDHNDLSAATGAALAIERGADRITVSWNHLQDQDETALVGLSDGDAGQLRVTYHHNWFDGTTRSNPYVRSGNPVHVVNNYFSDIAGEGVVATAGAGLLVEANCFEDVVDPFDLGGGELPAGSLVARDNHMVRSGPGRTGGTVAPIPYAYPADPATSVKSLVTAIAGPQPTA